MLTLNQCFVGMRVKLIDKHGMNAEIGSTATIVKLSPPQYIYVKWDRNELARQQMDGEYEPQHFDCIELKNMSLEQTIETAIQTLRSSYGQV